MYHLLGEDSAASGQDEESTVVMASTCLQLPNTRALSLSHHFVGLSLLWGLIARAWALTCGYSKKLSSGSLQGKA